MVFIGAMKNNNLKLLYIYLKIPSGSFPPEGIFWVKYFNLFNTILTIFDKKFCLKGGKWK